MLKLEPVTYQSLPLAIDEDLEFRWQYTSQQTDTEDEQETNKVSQVVKKAKAKGKLREEDEGEGDVREGKGQPKGNH